MTVRHVLLSMCFALTACATDDATPDDSSSTSTVEQGLQRCSTFNTGSWGCHTDDWCDYRCKRDADGAYPFGWTDHCEWHTNHWETVCGCCSF